MTSPPDVIAATGTPVIAALKQATGSIPIVFSVVNDPAGQGFVANLARPGGNITGFSYVDFPMIGKWLEIMKEVIPGVRRMTLMFNPETAPYYPVFLREFFAGGSPLAAEGFRLAGAQRSGDRSGSQQHPRASRGWPDCRT